MYPTGLNATDYKSLVACFGLNHRMRRTVQILDLNHNLVEDISQQFNDGQVNVDADSSPTRLATAVMFDPTHSIGLDTDDPAAGTVAPIYMLRLKRGMYVEALGVWHDIPVFTGPITRPSRDGDMLTIEAQGKEYLAQDLAWHTIVVKKGTNKVDAIHKLMGDGAGETRFRMPATTAKLTKDVTLSRSKTPWQVAKSIAKGMGRTFYYDGAGTLVVTPKSTTSVFTFSTGTGGTVCTPAKIGNNERDTVNLVYVTGGTPKGAKTPVTGYAVAESSHPLSPQHLAVNGVPRFKRLDVSDDSIRSKSAADRLAKDELVGALVQSTTLQFDSLPVWLLEEGDYYTLRDDVAGFSVKAAVKQMSIPLTCSGNQSNGTRKLVSRPIRKIRRR